MSQQRVVKLSRRSFLRLAGIAAAGGVLAACQPQAAVEEPEEEKVEPAVQPTEAPPEPEGVTIDYWVHWPQYERLVEPIQNDPTWQELMGPNTVNISVGVTGEVWSANLAAGTPPEVGQVGWERLRDDLVLPLDGFAEASDIIRAENYTEQGWQASHWEGKLYGVPANESFFAVGLNYNSRMVEEAGLDPDNPPVTWEEAFAWHEKLTKFDAAGNLIQIGLDPYDAVGSKRPPSSFAVGLSWGYANSWYDPETNEFSFDTEDVAESLETLAEFVRFIGPDNLAGMRSVEGQGTWGGSYNAEVQAMIIEGYWHPGETANEAPEVSAVNRATWCPVPERRRGAKVQALNPGHIGLYKDSKNPEAGWPVCEYFSTTSGMDILFNTLGWLIPHIPYLEATDPSVYPGLDFYFTSATEANEWQIDLHCPIAGFVSQKWIEIREAVYRDELTGAEAATELQEVCTQELIDAGFA